MRSTAYPPRFGPSAILVFLLCYFDISRSAGNRTDRIFLSGAITVACSYRIFRELPVSNAFAVFGLFVIAVFPELIFYENLLLSEILMTAVLSIALLMLILARRHYQFLLTGIFFGIATLIKS
jgi:hypothetical protein